MKKSIFTKVGAAAVVLTLVTASLVGGTFAKYTSTVSGTAKATVAQWKIAVKDSADTALSDKFDLSIVNSNDALVTNDGKVAPGASGSFEIKIDGTGSEVGYSYSVKATGTTLNNIPLKFYSDAEMKTEIVGVEDATSDAPVELAKGNVELKDVGTAKSVPVYWKWDPASADADDNKLGTAATAPEGTINITVTAEQYSPVPTT